MRLTFEDDAEGQDAESAGHQPIAIFRQVLDLMEMADQAGNRERHGHEEQQQGKS